MAFSLHGIRLPHRKNTADTAVVRMGAPKSVTLPTVMHIGVPAVPVVKVGDHVDVGTLVARQEGAISSPIYSSVSGKVTGIADMLLSNGKLAPAITIESDGEMTVAESIAPPVINSKEALLEAVKASGIVGLGGAGFPTYAKLATDKKIEALIINGAECEPYITSDSVTMTENSDDIACAVEALIKYLDIGKVIIGVEKNKPKCIAKMKEIASSNPKVSVSVLPTIYPGGGEKVLIYSTTGKKLAAGKLPADVGCVVCNCTTVAAIGKYIKTGMPLVEKCITVDGSAVKNPKNIIVPIGTSLRDVFEFCGGFSSEPGKVIYGGPMMGVAVPDINVPVLKQTNAVLAFNEKDSTPPKTTACVRCGTCTNNCPLGINPAAIEKAYEKGEFASLEKLGAELCMECGCCSYNCPAARPLVQTNKLAKAALREYKAKEKEANE